jgi:hypothetical protein
MTILLGGSRFVLQYFHLIYWLNLMGTWGIGNFDNSEAAEWVQVFIVHPNIKILNVIFKPFKDNPEGYFEMPDCNEALAAAEIVAAIKGKPSPELPDLLINAIADLRTEEGLDILAKDVVEMIEKHSELQELWAQSENYEDWKEVLSDLKKRLV